MKMTLVAGLTAGLLLIFGVVWLFGLLIIMNGVPEAKATPILISYLVLVIIIVVLFGLAGGWTTRMLVTTWHWNIWASGLLILLALGIGGVIVQVIGSIVIMLSFGVR